jgi:hypothetical protein
VLSINLLLATISVSLISASLGLAMTSTVSAARSV